MATMNKRFTNSIVLGGATALIAGTIVPVHIDEHGQVVISAQPNPHLWDTHSDSVVWPPNQPPVAHVTSGTTVHVPVATLNLQGFAPTVRVTG